ncbi:hypothetical protein TIFTF001_021559 [Ficus carica]|uniref:Inositol-tetrakisphosphate 1-kinase n=1 Tax=Ficus carica TaxID=3494 RepID=A0AA88AYX1_FICCA|nr:hypothetical protein TIFTF001_021559 [Ficus carica]
MQLPVSPLRFLSYENLEQKDITIPVSGLSHKHDALCGLLPPIKWISIHWELKDFRQKHPEVTVLDPPKAIQHLHNRQSMLQDVADLDLSDYHGKVGIPRQLVITKDPSSIPIEVTKAGLRLPLVAKPLIVDGTAKSHELFLAYDQFSLQELVPPLVLQEFVNHGGVLFKVYIVGESIKVVRRFSLPDVTKCELAKVAGLFRFPRVSCAAATADEADLDPSIAELPPRPLLERLAEELRRRLGLRLFNIDMIRELGTGDVFYVIDINYFPGKLWKNAGIRTRIYRFSTEPSAEPVQEEASHLICGVVDDVSCRHRSLENEEQITSSF